MRLCPNSFTQCIFVSARLRRWYPLHFRQMARPRYFDARSASLRAMAPALDGFHGFAFLRGGMTAWAPRSATASWHLRVSYAPSAVTEASSTSEDIWSRSSGSMGASPTLLPVISMARISSVCSSTPMWILRQRRRFAPPCLRACHSPSPSALMPVLSIARQSPLAAMRGDQKVQRPLRAPIGNGHGQGFLSPAQRAEIRHRPVDADQAQQALHEPGRLSERHAEEGLHRQARLDRGIAVLWLPASLARWRRHPGHVRIEPDRQGAALLQRFVVGRPVPGLVARRDGSAHADQLPRWIREMNPSPGLCATKPGGSQ